MSDSVNPQPPSGFTVRPEVAALHDTSFVLCGLFSCESCGALPSQATEAAPCSDHHYYLVAAQAYDEGWRDHRGVEFGALCPACLVAAAENSIPAGGE